MISKTLYMADATSEGGRGGHVRTADGQLDLALDVPAEMGGPGGPGTNPQQLFAAGYAACFQSALLHVAAGKKLALPRSKLIAHVGIGPASEGGFGLTVALDLDASELDRAQATILMEQAHAYSRATRGNIDVALGVGGTSIERVAASLVNQVKSGRCAPARPTPRPRLILVAVLTPSTPPLRSGVGSALTGLRAATRGTYRGTAERTLWDFRHRGARPCLAPLAWAVRCTLRAATLSWVGTTGQV